MVRFVYKESGILKGRPLHSAWWQSTSLARVLFFCNVVMPVWIKVMSLGGSNIDKQYPSIGRLTSHS